MSEIPLEEPEEEMHVWPAFVDLLAATSLLSVTLVAVFIFVAHRAQAQTEAEAEGLRTERRTLVQQLRNTQAHGQVYTVEDDSQFVRVILKEEATFPRGQFVWSTLRDTGQRALTEIGRTLMSDSISPLYRQIRVIGHSDDVPYTTAGFTNWELSASRAAVVARYLVDWVGVNPCKISAAGVGPYYPLDGLDSLSVEERNARNRRIEIEIVPVRAAGVAEGPACNPTGDGTALGVREW